MALYFLLARIVPDKQIHIDWEYIVSGIGLIGLIQWEIRARR